MSRRTETEAAIRKAREAFEEEDTYPGAADIMLQTINAAAMMELARSLAEVADELHEIRHKLEKLDNSVNRRMK